MSLLFRTLAGRTTLQKTLARHFNPVEMSQVVTAARDFPVTSRVDIQAALDAWFQPRPDARLLGVHTQMGHETVTLAHLFTSGPFGVDVGPLQHDEISSSILSGPRSMGDWSISMSASFARVSL